MASLEVISWPPVVAPLTSSLAVATDGVISPVASGGEDRSGMSSPSVASPSSGSLLGTAEGADLETEAAESTDAVDIAAQAIGDSVRKDQKKSEGADTDRAATEAEARGRMRARLRSSSVSSVSKQGTEADDGGQQAKDGDLDPGVEERKSSESEARVQAVVEGKAGRISGTETPARKKRGQGMEQPRELAVSMKTSGMGAGNSVSKTSNISAASEEKVDKKENRLGRSAPKQRSEAEGASGKASKQTPVSPADAVTAATSIVSRVGVEAASMESLGQPLSSKATGGLGKGSEGSSIIAPASTVSTVALERSGLPNPDSPVGAPKKRRHGSSEGDPRPQKAFVTDGKDSTAGKATEISGGSGVSKGASAITTGGKDSRRRTAVRDDDEWRQRQRKVGELAAAAAESVLKARAEAAKARAAEESRASKATEGKKGTKKTRAAKNAEAAKGSENTSTITAFAEGRARVLATRGNRGSQTKASNSAKAGRRSKAGEGVDIPKLPGVDVAAESVKVARPAEVAKNAAATRIASDAGAADDRDGVHNFAAASERFPNATAAGKVLSRVEEAAQAKRVGAREMVKGGISVTGAGIVMKQVSMCTFQSTVVVDDRCIVLMLKRIERNTRPYQPLFFSTFSVLHLAFRPRNAAPACAFRPDVRSDCNS